ncbi:extensin-like [Iris pallida]|uniref:Extensin-like n=1 Tax=Iris pallida TaxID=29817 RepID=A0AAX6HMX6_IRIPA|nr:extensin-like [Iris pallida]
MPLEHPCPIAATTHRPPFITISTTSHPANPNSAIHTSINITIHLLYPPRHPQTPNKHPDTNRPTITTRPHRSHATNKRPSPPPLNTHTLPLRRVRRTWR